MSDRSRHAFGNARSLASAMAEAARRGSTGGDPGVTFSPLLEKGGRVVLSAEVENSLGGASGGALPEIYGRLLRQYFRLQIAERSLTARVRARKAPGPAAEGRRAVRQIELERQRLSRELHTGAGQTLAAIRLQLEIIRSRLPEAPEAVAQALGRIATLASDALEQVRSVSRRLHPPEWQRLSLEESIRQLWELSGIPQRFQATLDLEPLAPEPELEAKVLLYRALQEALSNFTRHSRATAITVKLAACRGLLVLTVCDNGVGFDARRLFSAPANVAAGIGLRTIREQAAAVGGSLAIESGPQGTKLEVSVPIRSVE